MLFVFIIKSKTVLSAMSQLSYQNKVKLKRSLVVERFLILNINQRDNIHCFAALIMIYFKIHSSM